MSNDNEETPLLRAEVDLVVLELAEQHGPDFPEEVVKKYGKVQDKTYMGVVPILIAEGLMKETDGRPHLTTPGRQHLHNLRFQTYLREQIDNARSMLKNARTTLWVALAAIIVSVVLQGTELACQAPTRDDITTAEARP